MRLSKGCPQEASPSWQEGHFTGAISSRKSVESPDGHWVKVWLGTVGGPRSGRYSQGGEDVGRQAPGPLGTPPTRTCIYQGFTGHLQLVGCGSHTWNLWRAKHHGGSPKGAQSSLGQRPGAFESQGTSCMGGHRACTGASEELV